MDEIQEIIPKAAKEKLGISRCSVFQGNADTSSDIGIVNIVVCFAALNIDADKAKLGRRLNVVGGKIEAGIYSRVFYKEIRDDSRAIEISAKGETEVDIGSQDDFGIGFKLCQPAEIYIEVNGNL